MIRTTSMLPECLDIHFKGVQEGTRPQPRWIRGMTPFHGTFATHRPVGDSREFSHSPDFALELPFGFSKYRYAEPCYFGVCRGMAFVQLFRPNDQVWFSQSPSGGGTDCPAWDFQWHIPDPQVGKTYRMQLRAAYLPLPDPQHIQAVRDTVERAIPDLRFQ